MKRSIIATAALLAWLGVALNSSYARAETTACKEVGPLPFTITSSGIYCLKFNRQVGTLPSFHAIDIKANNVVLDLNGFRILGSGAPDSHDLGIHCEECRNVTVKNGTIQGFDTAVGLGGFASRSNVVEDIRAFRNTRLRLVRMANSIAAT
jgi:hypothetical protein